MALDNEWSLYEAAILLDAYLGVRAGSIERSSAVKNISCALRKMAKNCGQTIDAKYRNESGIHFQLLGMESAFVGRTVVKPASALFSKIVDLYRNSFEEYEAILSEARAMVDKPRSNIELFQDWLASNAPTLSCSAVLSDLAVAESYCMKKLLLKAPILDTTDVGVIRRVLAAVESDKIFRVTYKNRKNSIHKATALYYKYIKYLNTQHDDNSSAVTAHASEPEVNCSEIIPTDKKNPDPVLTYLEANDIEYIDQRGPAGCLWVIDNKPNMDALLNPLRAAGMIWVYTRDGGEVTNHRPAYWTKDSCPVFQTEQSADSIASTEPHDRPIGLPASTYSKTDDQSANEGSTGDIISDPVLAYLEANKIEYIDRRGRLGCLWVISTDPNVEALLNPLRAAGMKWSYARDGGKSTDYRPAFWTRDSSEGLCFERKKRTSSAGESPIENSVKDRRLRLKYPKEYKLIRKKLFEIAPEEGEGITLTALQDALNLQVAYFVSSDILSNAPWAERCGTGRYGMALFRYVGRFSEEEEDTASDSERPDSIKESLCQTIEYLKSRYSVRLAYDHFETPTKYSNDMLYKAKNACKDVMWIYYIHSRTSHYVSVETEPEYLESIGHDFSGFKSIIKRQSHPRLKMIFEDYEAIRLSLVKICDAIDEFFSKTATTSAYGKLPNAQTEEKRVVDWEKEFNLEHTKPLGFSYFGEFTQASTWADLYVKIIERLHADYPHILKPNMCLAEKDNGNIELADANAYSMIRRPRELIGTGIYVETNLSAKGIASRIKHLLELCLVDADNLMIYYSVSGSNEVERADLGNRMTIKEAVVKVLSEAGKALTASEILKIIEEQKLYTFNSNNPALVLYQVLRRFCKGVKAHNHSPVDVFDRCDENGQIRYKLIGDDATSEDSLSREFDDSVYDVRWQPILLESFPDGYILNDILCQLQAVGFWQERYGSACLIEGTDIDNAMQAVGAVRGDRVFAKSEEEREIIAAICADIIDVLLEYSSVYRSCVYERYREQLVACQIYSEEVMTQQLLKEANGAFVSKGKLFQKRWHTASIAEDCRKVLRAHGGAMSATAVATELWFIPYDVVYHKLVADTETLNIDNGEWMLAEYFPLTAEDAAKVGDMLEELFVAQEFLQAVDLLPLIERQLPSIAGNLSGLSFYAVFNGLNYYLKDRFSFSRAIIAPNGSKTEFRDLFGNFAKEHERFTLDELSAFAKELQSSIYWQSVFNGGAVRVSVTEFIHKRLIAFDVQAIDRVLESFCTDDYLPIQAVSPAMVMHLPSCGYTWNGYLLLSYVYGFSNVFKLCYNSFGKTGCYGAMVKKLGNRIDSYERLAENVLTLDDTWQSEEDALELLVKRGYQAQKRLKGIERICLKARQNKQFKTEG